MMRSMCGTGMGEKGFTLIEMIVVIVILGILSAVAIPKFVDLRSDAAIATADGVLGAARGAAAMNLANNIVKGNTTNARITADATGATKLLGLMDIDGQTWAASGGMLKATINNSAYTITITGETATAPAKLAESW